MNNSYYIGTDLKFLISIEAEGFSMDEDDYTIVLKCNGRQVTVGKDAIVEGSQGEHFLLVDSSQFGSGLLTMTVYADVPDEDFPDNSRTEVATMELCELRKV